MRRHMPCRGRHDTDHVRGVLRISICIILVLPAMVKLMEIHGPAVLVGIPIILAHGFGNRVRVAA